MNLSVAEPPIAPPAVVAKPRKKRKSKHPGVAYLEGVLDGSIVTSKLVRLQVERHYCDLETGADRGLYFDPKAAQHCIDFFAEFLQHTDGQWDGQPFILTPAQQAKVWILYGWKKDGGLRRFRYAYNEEGAGNGKSVFASGLCLYEFIAFGEAGPWVYSAATDKKTARLVWDTAEVMVRRNPELAALIERRAGVANMYIPGTVAKFEAVSSEDNNLQGLRPHFTLLDELHAHTSSGVWDVFDSRMGKRQQPLLMAITNSGTDRNSVCWRKREYSVKVLQGVFDDDTWFAWIQGIDDDDEWEDERCWPKANPNLGILMMWEEMREAARKAKNDPSSLNSFLRLRMGRWTQSDKAWMQMEEWDACNVNGGVDLEELRGRQCIAGLDLSTTTDTTALGLLFPPTQDDLLWRVVVRFFLPEEAIEKRVKKDRVPYDEWARDGHFILTPGRVVDYDYIRAEVQRVAEIVDLQEIAYDRFNSNDIVKRLEDDGFTMVKWGQGMLDMNAPTKRMMELVLERQLAHGRNPVLRWMASNVVVNTDPAGNIKPDKARSREKIDGIVALLMPLGRAMQMAAPQYVSSEPVWL